MLSPYFPVIALSRAFSFNTFAIGISAGIPRNAALFPALIVRIVCDVSFAGIMPGERLESLFSDRMEIADGLTPHPYRLDSPCGTQVLKITGP